MLYRVCTHLAVDILVAYMLDEFLDLNDIGFVENDPCRRGAPNYKEVEASGAEGVRTTGALLARRRPPRVWATTDAAEHQGRGICIYLPMTMETGIGVFMDPAS